MQQPPHQHCLEIGPPTHAFHRSRIIAVCTRRMKPGTNGEDGKETQTRRVAMIDAATRQEADPASFPSALLSLVISKSTAAAFAVSLAAVGRVQRKICVPGMNMSRRRRMRETERERLKGLSRHPKSEGEVAHSGAGKLAGFFKAATGRDLGQESARCLLQIVVGARRYRVIRECLI